MSPRSTRVSRCGLSEDFFIEARKVNPPDVRITRPAGEYHASPIEEVTVSVQAEDDFGLNDVGPSLFG